MEKNPILLIFCNHICLIIFCNFLLLILSSIHTSTIQLSNVQSVSYFLSSLFCDKISLLTLHSKFYSREGQLKFFSFLFYFLTFQTINRQFFLTSTISKVQPHRMRSVSLLENIVRDIKTYRHPSMLLDFPIFGTQTPQMEHRGENRIKIFISSQSAVHLQSFLRTTPKGIYAELLLSLIGFQRHHWPQVNI